MLRGTKPNVAKAMKGNAGMAELADANDSRSFDRKIMRVQVSLPAHGKEINRGV